MLRRHRVGGELEQLVAVGRGQRVVVPVVDLVLPGRVLVVHLLQFETEGRQVASHVIQKAVVAHDGLQVVGGLVQPVLIVGHLPAAGRTAAQEEELRLDAHVQGPAAFTQARHLAPQHLP